MNIHIYPKEELLAIWSHDKKCFNPDAADLPRCLRCGKSLDQRLPVKALSRALDVQICESCGTEEALDDWTGNVIPLREWYAVQSERLAPIDVTGAVTLMPYNTFKRIFTGPQKVVPGYGGSRPVSEVVYSRSDYDGRKWWTTWHRMQEEKVPAAKAQEIDCIMDSLLELSEFQDLRTLRRTCRLYAETTSEPTEFNLYGESPCFYLWLRLITREKDYNLYVHFYDKHIAGEAITTT